MYSFSFLSLTTVEENLKPTSKFLTFIDGFHFHITRRHNAPPPNPLSTYLFLLQLHLNTGSFYFAFPSFSQAAGTIKNTVYVSFIFTEFAFMYGSCPYFKCLILSFLGCYRSWFLVGFELYMVKDITWFKIFYITLNSTYIKSYNSNTCYTK